MTTLFRPAGLNELSLVWTPERRLVTELNRFQWLCRPALSRRVHKPKNLVHGSGVKPRICWVWANCSRPFTGAKSGRGAGVGPAHRVSNSHVPFQKPKGPNFCRNLREFESELSSAMDRPTEGPARRTR